VLDGHPPTATPAGRSASTTRLGPRPPRRRRHHQLHHQAITTSNQPAHCGRAL